MNYIDIHVTSTLSTLSHMTVFHVPFNIYRVELTPKRGINMKAKVFFTHTCSQGSWRSNLSKMYGCLQGVGSRGGYVNSFIMDEKGDNKHNPLIKLKANSFQLDLTRLI
jgi:hypothetical protein